MMDITTHDGVAVLHLGDGPNTFDPGFVDALDDALGRVEADESARALVTTAGGKHYSNGFDLGFLGGAGRDEARRFLDRTSAMLARLLAFPLPTAAAVNGHAFGVGAMLVLAHDQRVMNAERGWWCLPEVDLNLRFEPSQLAMVTGRLDRSTAFEAVLSGRRYDGPAAREAGIVDAVAAPGKLVTAATDLLTPYRGKQRDSLAALKRQLNAAILAAGPG